MRRSVRASAERQRDFPAPEEAFRLSSAGGRGLGVYTRVAFPEAGAALLRFAGDRLRTSQVADMSRVLQVREDLYLGPSGDLDDFVNHSCSPNAGVLEVGELFCLVSLAPIAAGEELTFDYSTTMTGDHWQLDACSCGADCCRGVIRDFRLLAPDVQERYLRSGVVPSFVMRDLARAQFGDDRRPPAG